jgi:hypothetical protein
MVGAPGFEPGTSCSQSKRATGLRYAPNGKNLMFVELVTLGTLAPQRHALAGLRYAPIEAELYRKFYKDLTILCVDSSYSRN